MKNKIILALLLTFILLMTGCKDEFKSNREARGVWMSRFDYTSADRSRERMKSNILNSLRNVRAAKMNMVFFQVRGNADAFYKSDYEPWSALLTGELGKDPGWDPLEYALETAHSLGIELHAWINTYPAWRAKDNVPPECYPRHIMLQHPEWIVCDKNGDMMKPEEGYISLSPGVPAVNEHITKVVLDLVKKYDIDGVHFDYIRYPEESIEKGYSNDRISRERFNSASGNPKYLKWDDWQREQINNFVKGVSDSVKNIKPFVKVSAAVIGSYKENKWNAYSAVYQDPVNWLTAGKVDFITPMSYMKKEQFTGAMLEWKKVIGLEDIYPGLAAYKANEWGWSEIWDEIVYLRETGFKGFVVFAVNSLNKVWKKLGEDYLNGWANVPEYRSANKEIPGTVSGINAVRIDDNRVKIEWKYNDSVEDVYFNIYRSKSSRFSSASDMELAYITPRGVKSYIDNTSDDYYYYISVLDRYNREGKITGPVTVQKKSITFMEKKHDSERRN